MKVDICIIGGGAAGLIAAIFAKENNPASKVLILEKKNHVGKKIIASGNGKCNLSNEACEDAAETKDFFRKIGVLTRTDNEGRIYPHTEDSRTVRDALLQRATSLGVQVKTSAEVVSISMTKGFVIDTGSSQFEASKILIATGGKAGPQCGSTGDGFRFAKTFGHKVTKLVPVLTAVEIKESLESLAGIRAKGEVRLEFSGKEVFREAGEIQFTKDGISGICVFNLSRFMMIPVGKSFADGFDEYKIYIDFYPEFTEDEMSEIIASRRGMGFSDDKMADFLLKQPLADFIETMSGMNEGECVKLIKNFPLSPKNTKGWNFAQATHGGVTLDEINMETMESSLVSGLYFAGEVIDYDGPCGGYNLQNAWTTGAKAGIAMAMAERE